ncbi:MAG: hypothetical protein PSY14_16580 [bacterium]|nr:hypothetical protein [bacterium]
MRHMISLALILVLTACAAANTTPRRLTDDEVSKLSNDHLCVLAPTYNDPRIDAQIAKKKLDCDPRNLYCQGKGFKRGTKAYSTCFRNAQNKLVESRRMENPDYLHCTGMGFKPSTQAMATCLASWSEQQQTTRLIQLQQQSVEQGQRLEAMKIISGALNSEPERRPITTTNCSAVNNTMHCTTW